MSNNRGNEKMNCPRCDTKMIKGSLKEAGENVYISSPQSFDPSVLRAMVCPECGHVELIATEPEKLAQKDITDEEFDDLFPPDRDQ